MQNPLDAGPGPWLHPRDVAVAKVRKAEETTRSLAAFAKGIAFSDIANTRDDIAEVRRRKAENEEIEREEYLERVSRTAMLENRRRARQQEQEEALAHELERKKREEESKRREIQRICEEDPSLRELQAKLKMAYIAKERYEQLGERKVIEAQERAVTRSIEEAMEMERVKAIEAQERAEAARKSQILASKEVLQKQLRDKELREYLAAEEEGAREKAMVSTILQQIKREDEAESAQRQRAREETIRVIEEFKRQRQKSVEAQRAAARAEEVRIAEYLASQSVREEEVKRARAEDAAVRDAQYKSIVAAQEELRKQLEEEEALRWMLVEVEAEKRRFEADAKKKEEIERSRREMLAANAEQRRIRERAVAEESAKEGALIAQFLEKCKEDDRRDAIQRQIREEARARYMGEIRVQRDEKLAMYQAEKMEELKTLEEGKRKEEFRKRVIEEARRKLLEEHAANLRGFLPRGVLLSNADLDILKAFDSNRDGVLDADELDLAAAAFKALDPGAGRGEGGARAPAAAAPVRGGGPGGPSAPISRSGSIASSVGGGPSGTAGLLPGGGSFYGARKV